jgi:signal transduction histidine kinase
MAHHPRTGRLRRALRRVTRASYWRRELQVGRLLGPAYMSLLLRWFTWLLALLMSLPGMSQAYNTANTPLMLLVTAGWLVWLTAYLPITRAALPHGLRRRGSVRAIDNGITACVLDIAISGLAVYVTGGWGSPFYIFGMASVVMPALLFGYRAAFLAGIAFAGLFAIAVVSVPESVRRVQEEGNAAGLIGYVLVPIALGLFAAYLGDLARQLEAERDRVHRALIEAETLQAVTASGLRNVADPRRFVEETVASIRRRGWLRGFAIAYRLPAATIGEPPTEHAVSFGPVQPLVDTYWSNQRVLPSSQVLPLALGQGQRHHGLLIALQPFVELRRPYLTALAGQVSAALANAALYAETEALAAQAERTRLGREIHDGIAQSLFMLTLNLEACIELVEHDPERLRSRLQTLIELSRQTLWETRHYIHDLRPLLDDARGLRPAIENQAREFQTISSLPVTLRISGEEPRLSITTRQAIYRILQEALANVFKHAGARQVTVELAFEADAVRLTVADDGRGFQPDPATSGHGLGNMRARAIEAGGQFELVSLPEQGTRVSVMLPAQGAVGAGQAGPDASATSAEPTPTPVQT